MRADEPVLAGRSLVSGHDDDIKDTEHTTEVGESAIVARALLCASHAVGLMR